MRDRHHVEAAFANVSDEPGRNGEPSGIDRIIGRWRESKAGTPPELDFKAQKRNYAFRIYAHQQGFLPDPDEVQEQGPSVTAYPGMSREEAAQIVAWVKEGKCPDDVWASELLPVWGAIVAASQAGGTPKP